MLDRMICNSIKFTCTYSVIACKLLYSTGQSDKGTLCEQRQNYIKEQANFLVILYKLNFDGHFSPMALVVVKLGI